MNTNLPTVRLGRTPYQVTRLGLGCYQFTRRFGTTQAEALNILETAVEAGINFFDTAAMYGAGESEELVGRTLRQFRGKDLVVSSKVGQVNHTICRDMGDEAYRSEDALLRMIKHSLWLLQLDHLPILMIHEPDWKQWGFNLRTGDCVGLTVLEQLKKEGVIGAIGVGGWNCDVTANLIETGRIDVALVAGGLTLLNQPIRQRVVPAAKKANTGLIIGGVFGQGAKLMLEKDREAAQQFIDNPTHCGDPIYGKKLLALYDLSDRKQIGMAELGIRYAASAEDIHVHIPGAREVGHLTSNLASFAKGPLSPEIVQEIECIGKLS